MAEKTKSSESEEDKKAELHVDTNFRVGLRHDVKIL